MADETKAPENNENEYLSIEFVVLCEAQGEINTRLIKAAMDDAGIPTVLAGDALDTVHIYPAHDSKVLVPKRRLEEARRIVDIMMSPSDEGELVAGDGQTYCDACGAQVPEDATACPECGEKFE